MAKQLKVVEIIDQITVKGYKKNSYEKQVLRHLLRGGKLTQMQAYEMFGTIRLGAVIFNLREKGHPIITKDVLVSDNKSVGQYHYSPEALKYINQKKIDFLGSGK